MHCIEIDGEGVQEALEWLAGHLPIGMAPGTLLVALPSQERGEVVFLAANADCPGGVCSWFVSEAEVGRLVELSGAMAELTTYIGGVETSRVARREGGLDRPLLP